MTFCFPLLFQTSCSFGRESYDSWGRRKRRAVSDDGGEEQMRLSHEIIVLDYGDEQTSPHDFDKPPSRPRGGNCEFSNQPARATPRFLCAF